MKDDFFEKTFEQQKMEKFAKEFTERYQIKISFMLSERYIFGAQDSLRYFISSITADCNFPMTLKINKKLIEHAEKILKFIEGTNQEEK